MYAVIDTGSKQSRVSAGDQLQVELLDSQPDAEVGFTPLLLVDGDDVLAERDQLAGCTVKGKVIGEVKGKKIKGFTYKSKTRSRRRWGHRQRYTTVEITEINR